MSVTVVGPGYFLHLFASVWVFCFAERFVQMRENLVVRDWMLLVKVRPRKGTPEKVHLPTVVPCYLGR